jgi:hypothetical protein
MGLVLVANQDSIVESPAPAPVVEQDQRQCQGAIWARAIISGQYGDSPRRASRTRRGGPRSEGVVMIGGIR